MAAPRESPATPPPALRSHPETSAAALIIDAPIERAGIPALCESVRSVLERTSAADAIGCDVRALGAPDLAAVDALARLALTTQRAGRHIRLLHASCRLQELLAFVGLDDLVGVGGGLELEPGGQTEERKQPRGVEEEDDPGDPAG